MFELGDIYPLTDFQRNTREHIARMKRSGRPEVLTVNGKAEVVVQDAASYQQLLNALERVETIAGIRRGLESMKQGKGIPLEQADERIRRKHGIPR